MSQRGTSAMILFFMASLFILGDTIFNYTQGHGLAWRGIVIGLAVAACGVWFGTARREA